MSEDVYLLPEGYLLQEFEIKKRLGEGGFGVTYLAYDESLDTEVVLKEYLPQGFAKRHEGSTVLPISENSRNDFVWGLTRFQDEARTLAKFKHTNIVNVSRVFPGNGTAYMAMEYLRGGSLEDRLGKGEINAGNFLPILDQVVEGLKLVHSHDFLHRDLAPDNIMFKEDGTPVLIDFGAARMAVGSRSKPLSAIVKEGYAPIEQYNEKSPQGPFTDIYALSAVCYEVITGRRPPESTVRFDADHDPVEPLIGRFDDWPYAFLQAVDWGLSLKRQDRPQTLDAWQSVWKAVDAPNDDTTGGSAQNNGQAAADKSLYQMVRNAWKDGIVTVQEKENIYIAAEAMGRDRAWVDAAIEDMKPAVSKPFPPENSSTGNASDFIPPVRKNGSGLRIGLLALIVVIIGAGGYLFYNQQQNLGLVERDKSAYEMALRDNSITGYSLYLKKFPNGDFTEEAKAKLKILETIKADKAAYVRAEKTNSEAGYKAYLSKYPSGVHVNEATRKLNKLESSRLDRAAYNSAKSKNTEAAYKGYLDRYQNGVYRSQAQSAYTRLKARRQDREAYDRAVRANTESAYNQYLSRYPRGNYRNSARQKISALKKSAETKAYNETVNNKTVTNMRNFLSRYPSSSYKKYVAYNLATSYLRGENGATKNYAEAWRYYSISASLNYTAAIQQQGYMTYSGFSRKKDYAKAISYFKRSAAAGNYTGMEWLGHMNHYGYGVTKNLPVALDWYEKSVKAGNKGKHLTTRIDSIKKTLGEQYYQQGRNYEFGNNGRTKNYKQAMRLYKKSAAMDHPGGNSKVGYFYDRGFGVSKKDYKQALKYMRAGAKLKEKYALYNVGLYYRLGRGGVQKNMKTAINFFNRAGNAGHNKGYYQAGYLYEFGGSTVKNMRSARIAYRRAADAGYKEAMRAIARFYEKGLGGLSKSSSSAQYWRNRAK